MTKHQNDSSVADMVPGSDLVRLSTFDLFNPSSEHKLLRETVASFVKNEVESQALEFDREEKFNLPLFRKLGEMGLLGITCGADDGGSEMDALAAVIVHEEISASDPGFCLAYLAHAMLCAHNISINASPAQRQLFLPKLCNGEWVGAMGMSEPSVGTDVMRMETTAEKRGDKYILNGRKMWITNGTIDDQKTPCDVVLVYAKIKGDDGKSKISTFIVQKGFKGFSVGQKIQDKLGMRGSNTAELVFQDCEVPLSHIVGREGDSMLHMMRNLEIERLTLAAMGLGIARRSLDVMIQYSKDRHAFDEPLYAFGQIQKYIAESYADYQAARAYTYNVARALRLNHEGSRLDSDGAKLIATTMSKNVADRAIQVLGGYGYVGEYVVERLWRDAKLLEIGGGTLEAHQKNITRDLIRQLK